MIADDADLSWLRSPTKPTEPTGRRLRTADIFSGCGGMSLGVGEAARALGMGHEVVLAIDSSESALGIFRENFHPCVARSEPVEGSFDGDVGERLTSAERHLRTEVGSIDLLVGGPPCQGNSDLNNHTRREDPKNDLYFRMARCAEVMEPDHVLIENVPGVRHDKNNVVGRTADRLLALGYRVSSGVLEGTRLGVPQMRRRHFLVGSRAAEIDFASMNGRCPERSVGWAIADLLDLQGKTTFDTSSRHQAQNVARIDYLFDHDLYDLPDAQRPDCHRLQAHAYQGVYGRMRWDEPAPTITRGFGCTGQGRFVHPLRRRTLTPHEAARVQFFPDSFRFGDLGRRALQEVIGNAVPSRLAYVLVLELLRRSAGG